MVIVLWWYRAVVTTVIAASFLYTVSLLPSSVEHPAAGVVVGMTSSALLAMTVRAARSARMAVSIEGVVLYELLRTRRIPISDIRSVEVSSGSTLMLDWKVPVLVLEDESVVYANELRSLDPGGIAGQAASLVRRTLGSV